MYVRHLYRYCRLQSVVVCQTVTDKIRQESRIQHGIYLIYTQQKRTSLLQSRGRERERNEGDTGRESVA